MKNGIRKSNTDENCEYHCEELYDFGKPDKFSKAQINAVKNVHEQFARLTTTSLSTRLKTSVTVTLDGVVLNFFGEFLNELQSPTTIAVLSIDPIGNAILESESTVTFAILEKLYGSGLQEFPIVKRAITDIEQHLISDIISALMSNLSTAWLFVTNIKPRISHIETDPEMIQFIDRNEMVMTLKFKVKINNSTGYINLCLPYITLEPVIPKLSPKLLNVGMNNPKLDKGDGKQISKIFSLIEDSKAKLSLTINTQMLPLIKIDSFKEGDEIPVCSLTDMVNIKINDYTVMEGNLGHKDNKWSVKVRKFTNE